MYAHGFIPQNPDIAFSIAVHDYCLDNVGQTKKRKREKNETQKITNKKSEKKVQGFSRYANKFLNCLNLSFHSTVPLQCVL